MKPALRVVKPTARSFVLRSLCEHAVLVALLVVASAVSTVVYRLTEGGIPKAYTREVPRLNMLDLAGDKPRSLWKDEEFECIGWRATHDCDPFGPRDLSRDRGCNETIPHSSGYCEVRNRTSGQIMRVMLSTCKSWQWRLVPTLSCADARQFTDYSIAAVEYKPPPSHSVAALAAGLASKRGIVLVAYPKVIAGVYAIVRTLRSHGCLLPVEIWIDPMEMHTRHTVLQDLVQRFHCIVRVIQDPHATKFHAKPYAIYHSRFESVLFLDSDNIPVRDPTYLFDSPEFKKFGAIFWPDFWRPMVRTPFNVQQQSALWRLLDMPFTDMFEQESGQILVNRSRSAEALSKLMFYSSHMPRLITDWQLVWGDKDLFRLAWLNTSTPFHMIQHLVILGGVYNPQDDFFCGVAMVQRDPAGDILFMHRNQVKLSGRPDDSKVLITHFQKFTGGDGTARSLPRDLDKYRVTADDHSSGHYSCFYLRQSTLDGEKTPFRIENLEGTRYPQVEEQAIQFSIEGRNLFTKSEETEVSDVELSKLEEVERKRASRQFSLVLIGVGLGIAVGGLILTVTRRHSKSSSSSNIRWWLWIYYCWTRRRSQTWLLSRVTSKVPTSPVGDATAMVLPVAFSSDSGVNSELGSSNSSVAVTHGENRRRKTSFQFDA